MIAYLPIALFITVAFVLSAIIVIIPRLLAPYLLSRNKSSTYECGFDQLSPIENSFNIRFYLVAILFIIFDLEIILLFPWAVSLGHIGKLGFFSMMIFLAILTIGFIYEIVSGALEWD